MNPPDKPEPDRGWKFVQKLLDEEEVARIEKLTDAELEDEMRAEGFDLERIPNAEALLAKAARAAQEKERRRAPPVKRTRWAVLLAAATLTALVVAIAAMNVGAIVAFFQPKDDIHGFDGGFPWPQETAQQRAKKLRDDAVGACNEKRFEQCGGKLDEALKLDPAGESEPRVQQMRDEVYRSELPDVDRGRKPPVR